MIIVTIVLLNIKELQQESRNDSVNMCFNAYNVQFVNTCTLQGLKIPLARSHLRVKWTAGQVKVMTICVVLL